MKNLQLWLCATLIALLTAACGGSVDRLDHTGPGSSQPPVIMMSFVDAGSLPVATGDAGTGSSNTLQPGTCAPGEIVTCACMYGLKATQVCAPDGKSYGPCACGTSSSDSGSAEASVEVDAGSQPDALPAPDAQLQDDAAPAQDSAPSTDAQTFCAPGAFTDCTCSGATKPGWSLCSSDGAAWGACCCTAVLTDGTCAAEDAGTSVVPSPDAGTVACDPGVLAKTVWVANGDVALGSKGVPMYRVDIITNECEDLQAKVIGSTLTSADAMDAFDSSLFCQEPCVVPSDWNFGNAKLMVGANTLLGPVGFQRLMVGSSSQLYFDAPFNDSNVAPIFLPKGTTTTVEVRMDVADHEVVPMVGKRFTLQFTGIGVWGSKGFVHASFNQPMNLGSITIVN